MLIQVITPSRRAMINLESIEFRISGDGFMRMETPIGDRCDQLVTHFEASEINAGLEPPEEISQ